MNEFIILFATSLNTEIFAMDYGSDDDQSSFWMMGPIGAVAFYSWVYLRYRNTNKRHEYEKKTSAELADVRGADRKVSSVRGVQNSRIPHENSSSPRSRLGPASTFVESWHTPSANQNRAQE